MKLIEPCCAERHVRELRNALGSGGSREIEGYGDLSLTELLPAILTRYYEAEVLIAAPSVPDQAAEAIATWMRRSIARMDGRGRMNYIARLTIVADLSPELSPMASGWLRENPFPGRLTLIGSAQEDTALLMPDFAILGPVNMRYGRHFTATATTVREQVEEQWRKFTALADEKRLDKAAAYLFYEKGHPVQYLIHKMKYGDQPELGFWMARQAVLDCDNESFFEDIDLIVPMPLHPKRLRERGYNQSEYIAKGISDVTGIPIDLTHVTRTRNTPKQALQRGEERRENMAEAFAVNHPEQLYHKHILVVDDLITTGETMRSCLKAMKIIRGTKITVFALCKAR